MGDPLMPQQPVAQKPGPKASMPSTWSNTNVDISLDYLGPGMQPPKASQPTLSMMQHGKHKFMYFIEWLLVSSDF